MACRPMPDPRYTIIEYSNYMNLQFFTCQQCKATLLPKTKAYSPAHLLWCNPWEKMMSHFFMFLPLGFTSEEARE